jgi:glycosyltransferase involved in cell wall biosynthesis
MALAQAACLAGRIVFVGEQADVRPYLAASDIGIQPSHEEGFSNSVLEGMAAGLAMLVSDAGGNCEAVAHGAAGLVVPARAPDRLSAAILRLANDPSLRRRLGEVGRQRVRAHFDLDQAAAKLAELYSSLLETGIVPAHLAPPPEAELGLAPCAE